LICKRDRKQSYTREFGGVNFKKSRKYCPGLFKKSSAVKKDNEIDFTFLAKSSLASCQNYCFQVE